MPDIPSIDPARIKLLVSQQKQTVQGAILKALNSSSLLATYKNNLPILARAITDAILLNDYPDEIFPRYAASGLLIEHGFSGFFREQVTEIVEIVNRILVNVSGHQQQAEVNPVLCIPSTMHLEQATHTRLLKPEITNPKANPRITDPKSKEFDLVCWVNDVYLPAVIPLDELREKGQLTDKVICAWVDEVIKPIDPEFDPYKYIKHDSEVSFKEWEGFNRALNRDVLPKINVIVTHTFDSEGKFGIARIIPELTQTVRTLGGRRLATYVTEPLYGLEMVSNSNAYLDRISFSLQSLKRFEQSHKAEVSLKEGFNKLKSRKLDFAKNPDLVLSYVGSEIFGDLSSDEALKRFRVLECAQLGAVSDSLAFAKAVSDKFKISFASQELELLVASSILLEQAVFRDILIRNRAVSHERFQRSAQVIIYLESLLKAMANSDFSIYYLGHKLQNESPGLTSKPIVSEGVKGLEIENLILGMPVLPHQEIKTDDRDDILWQDAQLTLSVHFAKKLFGKNIISRGTFYTLIGGRLDTVKPTKRARELEHINQELRHAAEEFYYENFFVQTDRDRNCPGWNS